MPLSLKTCSAGLALSSLALCAGLAACGGSSSTPPPPATATPTAVTFKAASAAVQKKIMSEMPHLASASVVTGRNDAPMFHWRGLFSEAVAADFGLGALWDPESGSAPQGTDFALINLYNGGGFTCSSPAVNTCTKGGVTIAGLESLKNYMGQALDPDFQNSNGAPITVFGRLKTVLMVPCVLGQSGAAMDTDGLPPLGALTIAFPSDTTSPVFQPPAAGGCGAPTEMAGQTVSGTVTAVTSGAYAKKVEVMQGSSVVSTVWLKLDATAGTLDMMTVEDERPQRYAANRTLVHVAGLGTPGAARVAFEYVSMGSADGSNADSCYGSNGWNCSYELDRGFIDESADVAYLVSNMGSPSGDADMTGASTPTNYIQYTAAGKPSELGACVAGGTCSGTLALSVAANGQREPGDGSVYPSAGNAYGACVDLASRAVATDDTLACDVAGTSVLAPGGASTMIEATRTIYAADAIATLLGGTSDSTTLAFTGASDIYTAPDTH